MTSGDDELAGLVLRPIGVVHSPLRTKADVDRQPAAVGDVEARIQVAAPYVDALADLEGFERVWVLFLFHLASSEPGARFERTRVQPPRSSVRRGVFATRSPHRPNPIGLSAVRIVGVHGADVVVSGLDAVDGTPVVDLKPYVPYADAFPDAASGWLDDEAARKDPIAPWEVRLSEEAEAAFAYLGDAGRALREATRRRLALGPAPHAYRRIRPAPDGDGHVMALGAFRVRFRSDEAARRLDVVRVRSGHRPRDLAVARPAEADDLALHRTFAARFPGPV